MDCMIAGRFTPHMTVILFIYFSETGVFFIFILSESYLKDKINSWFSYIRNSRGNLQITGANMQLGWTEWKDICIVHYSLCYLAQRRVSIVPPHGIA